MKKNTESDYDTPLGTLNTPLGTLKHTFGDFQHLLTIKKVLVMGLAWDMQSTARKRAATTSPN
jgi:hypothetical protein